MPPKPSASTPTPPPTPNPSPVSAPTCSSTAPPCSNSLSSKRPTRSPYRGGIAPLQPGPRTSTDPPLGNRQPQPRYDPRQHYRTGQAHLHDHRHGKLHPRPSHRFRGKEISPRD